MRPITSTMETAVTGTKTNRMLVKGVVQPSRTAFNALDYSNEYDASPNYGAITETPVGQCMIYSPYLDKAVTFIVDPSTGVIYAMEQDSATKNNLGVSADADTKPAAYDLGNGSAYLWYWDGSNLKRTTVNLTTWAVSGTTTITIDYLPSYWTVSGGSPIHLSGSQLAFMYKTSIGGIGVGYFDGTRWHHWDGRFMSPNTLTVLDWTIHTAAVIHGSSLFFYSTDMTTGEVRGVTYNWGNQTTWTDSFIALPADLSRFCITNAISANGYVHLAGQFHRTGDLANAKIYSLVLRSSNGRVFSWDRFTMLSPLGYQFQIALDQGNGKLYASDRNAVGIPNASYFFVTTPNNTVTLQPPRDIISFQLSDPSAGNMQVKAYDEAYYDDPTVVKGSRIMLYLGYTTSAGTEYVHYGNFIISEKRTGFRSGTREIQLGLKDEGSWKTDQIAFPFYSEIISKSSIHDDCDERDHMYPVETASNYTFNELVVDFWGNDEWDGDGQVSSPIPFKFRGGKNTACERESWDLDSATDELTVKTINLNEYELLSDYPTVATGGTVTMKLYGWERGDASTRANSDWTLYAITAPTDDLDNKTVTTGFLTSTYGTFPQYYPDNENGDYPITFEWSSAHTNALTAGDALLYIGVSIFNSSSGKSTGSPERIEITGVEFSYSTLNSSEGWSLENPDPSTYSREYLKLPDSGLPSIMFTTKPYTAFKFNVSSEFIYIAGSVPLSVGMTAWGVVGLAKNGYDYVVCRYRRQASQIEIIKVRSGQETLLAYWTAGSEPLDIRMDHRDGLFRVWYRVSGTTWIGPVLKYTWNEVTQGVMSTSTSGIMHTGIYGAASPPGFLCPGLNVSDADGVAMIAGQDESVLQAFPPNGGTVVIDGQKYDYSSRISSTGVRYGPYQGRQSMDYGSYDNFDGFAGEISLYLPDQSNNHVAGLLFHTSLGNHTWKITNTDWTVVHHNSGKANPLRNRSRHFVDNGHGNYVGPAYRTYITPGLLGLDMQGDTGIYSHTFGSLVTLYGSDKILAKRVVSTAVDHDATVRDMIAFLCRTASVETEFPGDFTQTSQALTATPVQIAPSETLFPGGFDFYYTIPALSSGESIAVYASNLYVGDDQSTEAIDIGLRNQSGILEVYSYPKSGTWQAEYIQTELDPSMAHDCRVLFHGEFCSVYLDSVWVATFAYGEDNLHWPSDQVNLYMYASTSKTVTNLVLVELFDWREAIYVESEMSAQSALGSVIQERPIEISTTVNGGLAFSYNLVRDSITYLAAHTKAIMHSHFKQDTTNSDAGSDAIVYYADIDFAGYTPFAQNEGFLTRVLKMSALDTGAGKAARIILEKAYERQFMHNFSIRPDPRIEVGDKITFTYIVPGTNRNVNFTVIVENLGIGVREGDYTMTVSAREDI